MATNGTARSNGKRQAPYERATLGFKNYWYPIFGSGEVGKKPRGIKVLGEEVVVMRGQKNGKVYALDNECVHRGTLLSAGRGCEFKGTNSITCGYHGWTYSLETGMCLAVLPEGLGSRVPGKVKQRTYPIEERKGIVWIWMGAEKPVPVEDDIPNLMMRDDTIVRHQHKTRYGNWRWHAENPAGGHAQMVHRDSPHLWTLRPLPSFMPGDAVIFEDPDGQGVQCPDIREGNVGDVPKKLPPIGVEFPGLGRWYLPPLWRRIVFWPWMRSERRATATSANIHGTQSGKLFLPGVYRQPHFPSIGGSYYEWYVPVDEDHYDYFQVACMWGSSALGRLGRKLWYYLYGKPSGLTLFNNQDVTWVGQTTNFVKRHEGAVYPMVKLSQHDAFHTRWREFANEYARGEGSRYLDGAVQNEAKDATAEPHPAEAVREVPVGTGSTKD